MTGWLDWLRTVDEPAALVTVLASEGSAPRGAGTRMLVTAAGSRGTIGGGALEFRATEQARRCLGGPPGSWRIQDYPLGPLLGQCCGGRVRLLIEHIDPAELGWLDGAVEGQVLVETLGAAHVGRRVDDAAVAPPVSARGDIPAAGARFVERIGQRRRPVYLFGAGHVGQAVARHSVGLPLAFAWFDTRPDFAAVDGVTIVADDASEGCVADAPDDAAIVVMTHDHALDYRLTKAALARPRSFVGLIGSTTKRARFTARLRAEGVDDAALACPIGVAGIGGKEPDVIAIAVLAQLLQLGACA